MFASRPSHHKPADIPTGYFLNPRHGYFSVVIPKEATNLITNPSVELATTGYAAFNGAAITRTATYQRHGTYSLSVIPAVSANCGVYYSSIARPSTPGPGCPCKTRRPCASLESASGSASGSSGLPL